MAVAILKYLANMSQKYFLFITALISPMMGSLKGL